MCEFELFAARLTDSRAPIVKTVFLTFDLNVFLHVTLITSGRGIAPACLFENNGEK